MGRTSSTLKKGIKKLDFPPTKLEASFERPYLRPCNSDRDNYGVYGYLLDESFPELFRTSNSMYQSKVIIVEMFKRETQGRELSAK